MRSFLAIGTRKGLFLAESEGRGRPWELRGPYLTMNEVPAIAIDTRRNPPRLLVATTHGHWGPGLRRSDDFGGTWQETPEGAIGLPDWTGRSLTGIWELQPAPAERPGVVYAAVAPAALFRSDDDGEHFHLVEGLWNHPHRSRLIEWLPESGALYLHSVLVHPDRPSTLTVGIAAGGVYQSTDEGATWYPANSGIISHHLPEEYPEFGQCVHKIAMVPSRSDQLFLQNHGGVYRSDDGGAKWTSIGEGLPADFGFALTAHPHRPGTAYVFPLGADTERIPPGARCRVYRTEDAGRSWQALTDGLPQERFYATVLRDAICTDGGDPAGVYLGTRNGEVYASGDDGDTWRSVATHLPDVLCLRAVHSEDGLTWS